MCLLTPGWSLGGRHELVRQGKRARSRGHSHIKYVDPPGGSRAGPGAARPACLWYPPATMPETDPAGAWVQLARLEREHGLLGRDVVAIDLRLPGRLVVRTAPDARIKNAVPKAGRTT